MQQGALLSRPQYLVRAHRAVIAAAAAIVAVVSFLVAEARAQIAQRSTTAGVYTDSQAIRGENIFATVCVSCHTPQEMTGVDFKKKWFGFPLWDLFDYLSTSMPESDPGTLKPAEYAQVTAYLLKLNGMPAGKDSIVPDTLALKAIKVDTVKAGMMKASPVLSKAAPTAKSGR